MKETKKDAIQPSSPALPAVPPAQMVHIDTLITAPRAMRRVGFGDADSLEAWVKRRPEEIDAIMWSEDGISFMLREDGLDVRFCPELHPATAVFMVRSSHSKLSGELEWQGEFEPVKFSKKALLQYLKTYAEYFDESVQDAVKHLSVAKRQTDSTELLDLSDDDDEENYRHVEESTQETNLPRTFTACMPIFGDVYAELKFEARVVPNKDSMGYNKAGGKNAIQVRCLNAREALKTSIASVVSRLPSSIPTYYGRMTIHRE